MVSKESYENGIRCRGICSICSENKDCHQRIVKNISICDNKQETKYPSINKAYQLPNNILIGVDQSSEGEDKTCLCFARLVKGKFHTERFEFIEKQEDMDKYINENTARWI